MIQNFNFFFFKDKQHSLALNSICCEFINKNLAHIQKMISEMHNDWRILIFMQLLIA